MPDGQTIVFERFRERGTRSDIATINVADGTEQTVLATRAWETNPIPSPDGTRIAFTGNRDRPGPKRHGLGFEVYTMALDGSDIVRLDEQPQARPSPRLAAAALTNGGLMFKTHHAFIIGAVAICSFAPAAHAGQAVRRELRRGDHAEHAGGQRPRGLSRGAGW